METFQDKKNDKIKKYSRREYLDGYIKNEFLTEDGDADLFLKIHSYDELFDTRTSEEQLDLAFEVYDFIEEKSSVLPNDVKINLHIQGIELSSHRQGQVKHILKEHYAIELYKIQKQYVRSRNKILALTITGILSFLVYTLIFFYSKNPFALEIFGFVFSFSLWKAIESYIYILSDIKVERDAVTQNLLIDVTFD